MTNIKYAIIGVVLIMPLTSKAEDVIPYVSAGLETSCDDECVWQARWEGGINTFKSLDIYLYHESNPRDELGMDLPDSGNHDENGIGIRYRYQWK